MQIYVHLIPKLYSMFNKHAAITITYIYINTLYTVLITLLCYV